MINILIEIAVTLIGWLILMFVCTNMIGFFVSGFFRNPALENIVASDEILAREYQKDNGVYVIANIVCLAAIIAFLILLNHFWNLGLVVAAVMLMVSRVPDLIWEIKKGGKLQLSDMTKPKFYLLSTLLSWASLPVLWHTIYRM
jgi:uncharacterized membrane protein YkgB